MLSACAAQPTPPDAAPGEQARTLSELDPAERERLLAEHPAVPIEMYDRRELRSRYPAGSRVTVFTREELQETGELSLGEALESLDPRIQIE